MGVVYFSLFVFFAIASMQAALAEDCIIEPSSLLCVIANDKKESCDVASHIVFFFIRLLIFGVPLWHTHSKRKNDGDEANEKKLRRTDDTGGSHTKGHRRCLRSTASRSARANYSHSTRENVSANFTASHDITERSDQRALELELDNTCTTLSNDEVSRYGSDPRAVAKPSTCCQPVNLVVSGASEPLRNCSVCSICDGM